MCVRTYEKRSSAIITVAATKAKGLGASKKKKRFHETNLERRESENNFTNADWVRSILIGLAWIEERPGKSGGRRRSGWIGKRERAHRLLLMTSQKKKKKKEWNFVVQRN